MNNGDLPRIKRMDVLQLLLNVIGITGVTSLSLICYLVKRDNLALATEVRLLRERQGGDATIAAQSSSVRPVKPPAKDEDISRYVAQRSRRWAALSVPAGN